MKNILSYICLSLVVFCTLGCEKDEEKPSINTIRVINTLSGVPGVKVNPAGSNSFYAKIPVINFGTSNFIFAETNAQNLTVVSSLDSNKVLHQENLSLQSSKIYSLYLHGSLNNPSAFFAEENNFPYIKLDRTPAKADSVTYVRFVNLVENIPLKINLLGYTNSPATPVRTHVPSVAPPTSLNFKAVSDWSKYPATAATSIAYNFEIRNALTDEVLISQYTLTITPSAGYFKNISLIVKGTIGGTDQQAPGIIRSNYYN